MDNNRFENQRFNNSDNIVIGRIINVDRQSGNISTISDRNPSSVIRFNISRATRIFDIFGRQMDLSSLSPGMRVRVRHASFMTPSIPPQTTAFEIRMIR